MSVEAPTDLQEVIEVQDLESEPPSPVQPLLLRVVLRTSRVRYNMHLLAVDPSASGQTVMKSLRELYNQDIGTHARHLGPLLRVVTMQDIAISSATVIPIDIEQQAYPITVSVENAEQSILLTAAYHRPSAHRNHGSFVWRHLLFAADIFGDVEPQKALMVGTTFSTRLACIWLAAAIFASILAGIGAGAINKSVLNGLGFSSGVLAMLTAIQGLLVWLSR